MLQCAEQEVAEPAALRIRPAQGAFLYQVDEEILCEVLRVLAAIAASTDEGVNRIAIKTIELLQGSAGFRGAFSRGGGNQSPLGREEAGPRASRRVKWCSHQRDFARKCLWPQEKAPRRSPGPFPCKPWRNSFGADLLAHIPMTRFRVLC